MKSNSTLLRALVCTLLLLTFNASTLLAQQFSTCTAPTMKWENAVLVSGIALQPDAIYKFPSVTDGVDAFVTIREFYNGATLTSIDDNTFGYSAAWQPVTRTPNVQGVSESWVSFKIEFNNAADGSEHKYDCAALSFIDVDGDNQHVREFVASKQPDSYSVSNITLLDVSVGKTSALDGSQSFDQFTKAVGPILNYAGIDTTSYRTNINFKYTNVKTIDEVRIGNITDSTFAVQDRFTCGYFAPIDMPFQILPVKYSAWDATVINNKTVGLKWTTTHESNNNHFEVERSFDMTHFSTAGMVLDGMALTGTGKSYEFRDNSSELKGKSKIYYRLKQVDNDGGYTYTSTLAVKLETGAAAVAMQVYPNPFTERVTLAFSSSENGLAELTVTNANGQQVLAKKSSLIKGGNMLQIDGLSKLQPGLYFVKLAVNGVVLDYQKIIKK